MPQLPERVLQRIEWTVVRRLDGLLQGDHRAIFRGQGLDLADIRVYVPGDDVRNIDWNVTARMDVPYVREFLEDREVAAHFLLDLSPSMDFGTAMTKKLDLLIDVVGALASILTRKGDRVGAILYGRGVERVVPARGGRMQVLRLLHHLTRRVRPERAPFTDLSELLGTAARTIKRRSLVFVVSDLIAAPGWEGPLAHLARRHEVLVIRIHDPREHDLPDIGGIHMTDAETGEQLFIDTGDPRFRARFAEVVRRREKQVADALRRARVEVLPISTEEDPVAAIVRFASLRKLRAARRRGAVAV